MEQPEFFRRTPFLSSVAAVSAVIAATSWLLYAPPYRWFAELQLAIAGKYVTALTFTLVLLVFIIGWAVIGNILIVTGVLQPKDQESRTIAD